MTDNLNLNLTSVFAWHNISAQLTIFNTTPEEVWSDAASVIGLHNRYFDSGDIHFLDSIAALSETFVAASIKAMGFAEIESFDREVAGVMTHNKDPYCDPPTSFSPTDDRVLKIRQAIAVANLWLGLQKAVQAAEKQAEKLGLTVEVFAAMDLRDRDVGLYQMAEKSNRGRLAKAPRRTMTEKNNYDGRLQMHSADDAILQSIVEARNFRSTCIKPAAIAAKMSEFSQEIGGRVGLLMVGMSGSSLLWHDDPGIIREIMRAVGQGQHVAGLFGFPPSGEVRFQSLERTSELTDLSEEFARATIEGLKLSEYEVMNAFLEFDVAVWVTFSQEDREIINPVLRKYLSPEMADYYTSRHRWTTGQVEMVIEKLISGRKSKAKTTAIELLKQHTG